MGKTLGLDLGTNSIGWALVDNEHKQIIKTGVRIFPEGINRDTKGSEVSKNESRRLARQARRNNFRTKMRKSILKKALIANELCPNGDTLTDWHALNPYELRSRALKEKLSLHEIGRILYHLSQRRGFKSSRKTANDKNEGSIFDGDEKIGKTGINETSDFIAKHGTLGNYLASLVPDKKPYNQLKRIRNRYTTRDMYIHEFQIVWEAQSKYYPTALNNELRDTIGHPEKGILFFQRPLRSQKFLIGKCTLEKKKPRCPSSALPFEEFRAWQFINSIQRWNSNGEIINFSTEERLAILDVINTSEKAFEFKKILNKIDKKRLYRYNYVPDHTVPANPTHAGLIKVFGNKLWNAMTEDDKETIWHNLFIAKENEWLKGETNSNSHRWSDRAKVLGLSDEQLEKLSKIHLKDDYANLSRKALNNILPFLRIGFIYSTAVLFGGIKNALGLLWDELSEESKNKVIEEINNLKESNTDERLNELIITYLIKRFSLSPTQLKKLYHHSDDEVLRKPELEELPQPKNLRNPLVQQALYELRNLVNHIIKQYGRPSEIRIELARDLKNPKKKRDEMRFENKQRERENTRIKLELEKLGELPSRDNIQKYALWEECKKQCPYTGKEISVTDLFGNKFQIEHIIPWSVSLDDSMANKTLCEANENRNKGDLTPYQYYGKNLEKWDEVKRRAYDLLPMYKYKRFIREEMAAPDDFIARQLNDTRYISREAKQYLSHVCKNILVTKGPLTAELRHYWGMNSILNPSENKKSRDDHRHHAVDAIVIACSKNSHFQELRSWNKYRKSHENHNFPEPWKGFLDEAKQSVESILVSHKNRHRLLSTTKKKIVKDGKKFTGQGVSARGTLHEETVYGKRKSPFGDEHFYTVRKPIGSLTPAMIRDKIVDPEIRKLIWERLMKYDINPNDKKFEIPKDAFAKPIYLRNKNGDPVPVFKVRIRVESSNILQMREGVNQWVDPKTNLMVILYRDQQGTLYEEVLNFFEATKRKINKQSLISIHENKQYFESIQKNDLFVLGLAKSQFRTYFSRPDILSKHLYKVEAISSKYYEFRLHCESTQKNNDFPEYLIISSLGAGKKGWLTFNPIKVKIDPLGNIVEDA
ncbi:type II CRISPR RNA-guided endonuclease Cas9 [bacterium]|nr:type II CRISPR RNA-guided endonuclease Cas9 [bacterium]NUN44593.1 type II CRISPR RNA-guided endonuclease Cas9 [bacterium]